VSFLSRLVPDVERLRDDAMGAAPWVFGAALLTLVLEVTGVLSPFANLAEDAFGILDAGLAPHEVAIVEVDETAFRQPSLFNGHRPLDAKALRRLIDVVARAHPRVIAVDFATTDVSLAKLQPDPSWPPIVWAQDVEQEAPDCSDPMDCTYRPLAVLGGASKAILGGPGACTLARSCAAIPVRITDADRIARRYQRLIDLPGLKGRSTFPRAVVELCASQRAALPACRVSEDRARGTANDQAMRFRYDDTWPGMRYNAQTAIGLASEAPDAWAHDAKLNGRIALIGGTYGFDDRHDTPGKLRDGLVINAEIIEGELSYVPLQKAPLAIGTVLDILIGFVLVYLAYRFAFWMALASSAAFVFAVMLVSYLSFRTTSVWLNFAPVVAGMAIHEFLDMMREYATLRRAHEETLASETAHRDAAETMLKAGR